MSDNIHVIEYIYYKSFLLHIYRVSHFNQSPRIAFLFLIVEKNVSKIKKLFGVID